MRILYHPPQFFCIVLTTWVGYGLSQRASASSLVEEMDPAGEPNDHGIHPSSIRKMRCNPATVDGCDISALVEDESSVERRWEGGHEGDFHIEFIGEAVGDVLRPDEYEPEGDPTETTSMPGLDLLKCEEGIWRGGTGSNRFNLHALCENMLRKLRQAGQKATAGYSEPVGDSFREEVVSQVPSRARPPSTLKNGFFATVLNSAGYLQAAPSVLYGVLGSVPGWFSEVVFEVNTTPTKTSGASGLPGRLILAQEPHWLARQACQILLPGKNFHDDNLGRGDIPTPGFLARFLCSHIVSQVPGWDVSRPCLGKEGQCSKDKDMLGWLVTFLVDDWEMGLGGGGASCCCALGGSGPCVVRAAPGRQPCLYLEEQLGWQAEVPGEGTGVGGVNFTSRVEFITAGGRLLSEVQVEGEGDRGQGWGSAAWLKVVSNGISWVLWGLPLNPLRIMVGIALLWHAQGLSCWRLFHYGLSGVLGVGVAMAVLSFRMVGEARKTVDTTPLGFALGVSIIAFLLVGPPSLLVMALSWASRGPQVVISTSLLFWEHGLGNSYPWAGKAFFMASALMGILITRMLGLFLEDPRPDGGFLSSWLNGRASLCRAIKLLGVHLLITGVSSLEVGITLSVAALCTPTLSHWANRIYMWRNKSRYRAAYHLSEEEYQRQGELYTAKALEELRQAQEGQVPSKVSYWSGALVEEWWGFLG
ncbi:unnamed protein product [Choristocarpus tenellus]